MPMRGVHSAAAEMFCEATFWHIDWIFSWAAASIPFLSPARPVASTMLMSEQPRKVRICLKNFVANSSLAPALVWLEVRTTTACLGYVGFGIDNAVAPSTLLRQTISTHAFRAAGMLKLYMGI